MSYFIPVVFVCLFGGNCGFIYGQAEYSESSCLEALKEMTSDIGSRQGVEAHMGSCIPLQAT